MAVLELNQANVDAIKLGDGKSEEFFWDKFLTGFAVRARYDSRAVLCRTYLIKYATEDGKKRHETIGDASRMLAATARERATKLFRKIAYGEDREKLREDKKRTFSIAVAPYLAQRKEQVEKGTLRPNSYRLLEAYLTKPMYFGPLHDTPVAKIKASDVTECLDAMSGDHTRRQASAHASTFFTFCQKRGYCTINPASLADVPKVASRERVLKDEELAAIWNACGGDSFGRAVRLMMLTLCRREEIGGLRHSETDGEWINLPSHRVKNGHAHTLPLVPLAREIIGQPRPGRDEMFELDDRKWRAGKSQLDQRLGEMEYWQLRDIRRTIATWMAEHNVEPHIIEAILNHASGHKAGVAGVYNRATYREPMREALVKWQDHLKQLVGANVVWLAAQTA